MFDTTGGTRRGRGGAFLAAIVALVGGSLFFAPAASAAPPEASITINAAPGTALEGESINLTVYATGIADLYAYDLVFAFDPALVAFDTDSTAGPDGGFTASAPGDGRVTLTHTRLGTSPGLTGAVELGSFSFTALAAGEATISLESAELVSSTSETASLADVDAATATITALADPGPTVSATPSPSATSSPSSSASPVTTAIPDSSRTDGSLASTGADTTSWLLGTAGAALLITLGALLLRRRQAVEK